MTTQKRSPGGRSFWKSVAVQEHLKIQNYRSSCFSSSAHSKATFVTSAIAKTTESRKTLTAATFAPIVLPSCAEQSTNVFLKSKYFSLNLRCSAWFNKLLLIEAVYDRRITFAYSKYLVFKNFNFQLR